MAHSLSLSDGTDTVNLLDQDAAFVMGDGWSTGGRGAAGDEVGESLNLLVTGATTAAVQATLRQIERLLERARRRAQTGVGPEVWLTVQLDGVATAQRSPIYDGALETAALLDQWGSRAVEATLALTRAAWWEAAAEVELQLSANGQAAATGGRSITNGAACWVGIDSAQVSGSEPAPLRLELTNTSGAARVFDEIQLALNADHDPANFGFLIEGETATGGSSVANGACSGGNARSVTVNTTATLTWTLTAANMQRARGAPFVVLARFQSITTGGVVTRLELKSGGVSLWRANEARSIVRTSPSLTALGVVPLPPTIWEADANAAIDLVVNFESLSSRTVLLDYLALLPAQDYQLLSMMGATVANNDVIVEHGIEEWAGVRSGGVVTAVVAARGRAPAVRPGVSQRLYLLQQTTTDCIIGDTFSVRAWYRPRSLTL